MFQYRLYVGCNVPSSVPPHKHEPDVVESIGLLRCPFDGCTVQHVTGVWKGEKEKTVVFEYIGIGAVWEYDNVLKWAALLKVDFGQEAVLVTRSAIERFFV